MNEVSFTNSLAGIFRSRKEVHTFIGDDAAALDLGRADGKLFLAAADQVIMSVHYLPETPVNLVARKLLNRNVSDIAAMGGIPEYALLTIAANPLDEARLMAFHKALSKVADEHKVSVIGGDIASLADKGEQASLTILGSVEKDKICQRNSAQDGDLLFVTGFFGRSFPTQHHLTFTPRVREARFLAGEYTRAMMDVSDGLAKDLSRFAADSNLEVEIPDPDLIPPRDSATIDERMNDGEDYELIIAVHPQKRDELLQRWPFQDVPLTCIGTFHRGVPGRLIVGGAEYAENGYDHFHKK